MKRRYKIEKIWISENYICVVAALEAGYRCGYVGIPLTHPLYNHHYNEPADCLNNLKDMLNNSSIGGRGIIPLVCHDPEDGISPEIFFDVHGGITYSGDRNYPIEIWHFEKLDNRSCATLYSQPFWLGYDCAHTGDAKDPSIMSEKQKEINRKYNLDFVYEGGIIRTLDYCKDQCDSLAYQLKYVEDSYA